MMMTRLKRLDLALAWIGGFVLMSLLRMALDAGPSLLYRLHLDTASLSTAEFYPDGNASVRLVNDTSHLG